MAKALMITGTNSSAGKSFLVMGLCRVLAKKGIRVCPFKAQNMSLQSFICKDGSEIGLAQALQAFSAGLEPQRYFNPILLKPEGKGRSQVVLLGKMYKTLSAEEYYKERDFLWRYVKEALDKLSSEYEVILLEGAGSPAEINLLEVDLVNIKPALYLKCPVLLVGDIDKGGVFASLFGTLELLKRLKPDYASLFRGFIINKFRGSLEILKPGLTQLKELTNQEVLGVLPYFEDLKLSDEDGFSFFNKKRPYKRGEIKVVILALRHISNFSDFDPFYLEEDVEVIYSLRKEDILQADIVILPGSKSVFEDLKELKKLNMRETLLLAKERGAEIIGICGGFQMLGEVLRDPEKVEGEYEEMEGLSLLPIETIFLREKITSQCLARPLFKENSQKQDEKLWGYEIHKGVSKGELNLFEIERLATKETLLDGSKRDSIWGTYLHGLFTNDTFRRELLNRHRLKKGLDPLPVKAFFWETLNASFDLLANFLEKHLDMEKIYRILGI